MTRPNLLVLMTDQQRADTLDPSSPCRTPNLQRLAAQGARFPRCYSTNPICSPSRASLMTGLLPHSHGMVDCTHTVEPYRADLKPGLPFWSREASGLRVSHRLLRKVAHRAFEPAGGFRIRCLRVDGELRGGRSGMPEGTRTPATWRAAGVLGLPESDRRWERKGIVGHPGIPGPAAARRGGRAGGGNPRALRLLAGDRLPERSGPQRSARGASS